MNDTRAFKAYYDSGKKCIWIQNDRGQWIEVGVDMLRLKLKEAGFSSSKRDKTQKHLTQIDAFISSLVSTWDVSYAGPLAGYEPGIIEQGNARILVTQGPNLITPEKGEWPLLKQLLQNLLGDEQLVFLYGWLQQGLRGLYEGTHKKGQCLVIAGPADCGKSFLQNRITTIFGGRASKPFLFMSGGTAFNRELLGTEHLQIEDEASQADTGSRKNLGSYVKSFVVNELQFCHGKNREAVNLAPRLRRLTMTTNDDPEDLHVIPPIRDSLVDKFILLKARDGKIPREDGELFLLRVERELPFFVNFLLNEFVIPEHLQSRRFGITHYHNPELLAAINDMEPEAEVLFYIDNYFFAGPHKTWAGSCQKFIEDMEFFVGNSVLRLLGNPTRVGKLLSRLSKLHPHRFIRDKAKKGRFWEILRDTVDTSNNLPTSSVDT